MFNSKRCILLLSLALCCLNLTAGFFDIFTRKPSEADKKLTQNIRKTSGEVQQLIASFAEKNEYELVQTINDSPSIIAFNDDGTVLTSVGYAGEDIHGNRQVEVIRRNLHAGLKKFKKIYVEYPRQMSGDGSTLVLDNNLIDTNTGNVIATVPPNYTKVVQINHKGTMLACTVNNIWLGSKQEVVLYSLKENKEIKLHPNYLIDTFHRNQTFSRNGQHFACVSDSKILLFDTATGDLKKTIKTDAVATENENDGIHALALNNDESLLAYSTVYPTKSELGIVNIPAGQIKKFKEANPVSQITALTHETLLGKGYGYSAIVSYITNLIFFNRRDNLCLIIQKDQNKFIQFLDLDKNVVIQNISTDNFSVPVAVSPDDKFVALTNKSSIEIWKRSTRFHDLLMKKEKEERINQQKRLQLQRMAAMHTWQGKSSKQAITGTFATPDLNPAVEPLDDNNSRTTIMETPD